MKTRILIVEDDAHIRLGLEELLKAESFEVASCDRGDTAEKACRIERPDLIVLDVMLPGKSGYDVCRDLRTSGCTLPILMLTAKGEEIDKVIGLNLGADDYVAKPFGVKELVARIQALLRRRTGESVPASNGRFIIGPSEIDPRRFEIRRAGRQEEVTPRELRLLQFLHQHRGEVLSRDRLLNEVWGVDYFGTTRTLDQTIAQVRKKLGDQSGRHGLIQTVHGVGYRLEEEAG